MDAGIVPIKKLEDAKTRLAEIFERDQRVAVARALVEDSFALISRARFLSWWVVTDDAEIGSAASDVDLGLVEDPGQGLGAALRKALGHVAEQGAASALIVPADVPLAEPGDIEDLIDTGHTSDVVVVPSRRDGGTNGLCLSPPNVIDPAFGPHSFKRHAATATRRGLRCSILDLPRLSLDIDTQEDIDAFLLEGKAGATHTGRLLADLRPPVSSAG
jgi:2-phospho-L-lactate/phosphoenolpyruvate guanylyltransferase